MHPWRARLERWFIPVARRCPLSPNTITVIALLLNAAAAWLFYERWFLVGMVFVIIGGFADSFDGVVARVQQKTSKWGDFLDHFCDRVSDSLLLVGWLLGNRVRIEIAIAVVLGVTLNGYIGTQIEATFGQRRYDTMGRGEYVLALVICPIVSHILFANGWDAVAPAGFLIAEWISLLLLVFAVLGIGQRTVLASRL